MGVFEEVFTKRGVEETAAEPELEASSGALEELFVRRGRWRKPMAQEAADVVHLAQHLAHESRATEDVNTATIGGDKALKQLGSTLDEPADSNRPAGIPVSISQAVQCIVRNTFLTTDGDEFDSLREFMQDRKVKSCPATRCGSFNVEDISCEDATELLADPAFKEVIFKTASTLADFGQDFTPSGDVVPRLCSFNTASTCMDIACLQSIAEMITESESASSDPGSCDYGAVPDISNNASGLPPPPVAVAPALPAALQISLAEAIAPPELGSERLPSIGSLLHHSGGCKPCTFFHSRGCENKENCQFCHLCGPNEKKKRLKALKRAERDAALVALENAKATLASWTDVEARMEMEMIVE